MRARGDGFEEFFDDHYAAVARSLALAGGDHHAAEEATQEAFARALDRWRSVRDMERPVGWVYVVALRELRRRQKRRRREEETPPAGLAAAADPAGRVATAVSVRTVLATLPPRQREAVVLRYLADLPIAEVATAMGCATGTVKSAVHAALAAMRVELEEVPDADAS